MEEARSVGGGGMAAARAKKASMTDDDDVEDGTAPKGVDVGSSMPFSRSTHVPQPSAQSGLSLAACRSPRCTIHPGHVQSKPHVQPVPAKEATTPRGGMAGKLGGWTLVGLPANDGGKVRIGGSAGPLRGLSAGDGLLVCDCAERRRRFEGGECDLFG